MSKIYLGKKYQWHCVEDRKAYAKGGNGEVYLVTCDELEGQYVCKKLKASRQNDKIKKQRFLNEVKTIRNIKDTELLNHIIPVIDEGPEGEFWYVMPKAQCLQDLLESHRLDFVTRLHYCVELGKVIKRMHNITEPIAHRDIKPENIFIYNGNVCLADFGIEWDLTNIIDTPNDTAIATLKTGPTWAMPFQWTDAANDLYFAIDVYEYVKTVWLILTMEKVVYKELYCYENSRLYLSWDKIHVDIEYNLFHLHELMTFANADNYKKMKSIDDCLRQLDLFYNVNFSKDEEAIRNANLEQAVFEITSVPDVQEYRGAEKIAYNLIKIAKYCILQMPEKYAICNMCISDVTIKPIGDEQKVISIKTELGTILNFVPKCLRVNIEKIKNIEIETVDIAEQNITGTKLSELLILPGIPLGDEEVLIDEKCIIKLVPKL